MGAREPKLQSYGELARRCLEHPSWPLDIQPQPRSLASLYSKFDRGIEVEWLHDRPEVQVVLANVLQLPATALEAEIKKYVTNADQQLNRWRLRDVPTARPLDLREDPCPKVFPELLTRPLSWQRHWWQDGFSQGAEFLGRWLEARSLASFGTCYEPTELIDLSHEETTPLLVFYFGPPVEFAAQTWGARPLCVVSRRPPPAGFASVLGLTYTTIEVPLLEWLFELLPRTDPWDLARVRQWLSGWRAQDIELNFETVTGLLGAASQLQLSMAEPTSVQVIAQQYLKHRLEQLEAAGMREAKWLRLNGLELPIGIAKNALLAADDSAWDQPRTKSEWLELIPAEYQRGVDADWTKLSLQRAGTPLTVAELEKALSDVPPGGFRVLNVLCDAQLLQATSDGKWALYPRWLTRFLERAAYMSLLDEDAEQWGKVALNDIHVKPLLASLERQFAAGQFRSLDAALELDDVSSPPFVLAIELLVVAAGNHLLSGGELETEQATGLLGLQASYLLDGVSSFAPPYAPNGHPLPRPRMLCLTRDAGIWGNWLLGIWALCEMLEGPSPMSGELNPWALKPNVSRAALESIATTLAQLEPGDGRASAIYSLLGRVLQHLDRTRETNGAASGRDDVTEAPLFAVSKVLRGDGWSAWQQALAIPHGIDSVRTLVAPEAWQYVAKTAWRTWLESGAQPVGLQLFSGTPQHRVLFWPHLPDRVLQTLLDSRHPIVLDVPGECMKAEWITMYLERVPEERDQAMKYLEVIPAGVLTEEHFEVLFELLEKHCLQDRAEPVFSKHSDAAFARLTTLLDQGRSAPASMWLAALPIEIRPRVLEHLRARVEREGPAYAGFPVCRAWLAALCSARVAGWLDVYPVLEEFEQRLKRVNRAFATPRALVNDAT